MNKFDSIPIRFGQAYPSANTVYTLFTAGVPPFPYPGMQPVQILTGMYVSNLDFQNGEDLVSLWIVPYGQSIANRYALVSNYPIQKAENIMKDRIILNPGDAIVVQSAKGKCSFAGFGEQDEWVRGMSSFLPKIYELKEKVLLGTDTPADREDLMLLTDAAYVVQTNNNTNNCSCP